MVKVDGREVALVGSNTSHGGVVVENGIAVSAES
jgi:uncharacterized Zn-binding protein involved in type VI secretion